MILVAVNAEGEQVGSVNAPDGNNWITEQSIRMRMRRRGLGIALGEKDVAERGVKLMTQAELDEVAAEPKTLARKGLVLMGAQ